MTNNEDLGFNPILGPKKEDLRESQFAYPRTKQKGPPGKPVRLGGDQFLILGTKKEDLPESHFAYPGDKEGGLAGEPVRLWGEPIRLSRGQRRRT